MTKVIIRAPMAEDMPALTAIANLPGVRRGTLRLPFTGEPEMRRRFLDQPPGVHPVVAVAGAEVRGWAVLRRLAGRQAHAGELYLAVHDAHWGKGIGRALMLAMLDLADNWLGLTRVSLTVLVDNERAIGLYESLGFEREGTLRGDILCEGRLHDSHAMARLRAAPQRHPGARGGPADG